MLHRLNFYAMGCEMLAIVDRDSVTPPNMLTSVPTWFEGWEQCLSRFRLDSELSQLNRMDDQPVRVSPVLWDVFTASLGADAFTDGLVTPTVMDAVIKAGYDRSFDHLPAMMRLSHSELLTRVHPLSLVIWDENDQTIHLPRGVHLDLGGVAKGWAAHQACERLQADGPALVDAAGDIAVSAPRLDGSRWPLGIANPFQTGENLALIHLDRGGVATSGKDRRHWQMGTLFHHHIIDPRTGQPAITDVLIATVIAPTVMEAEAAAKAVVILGSQPGFEWLEHHPHLAALLVLDDGQMLANHQLQGYLE